MAKLPLQSAKFKKDFMVLMAFLLFFLIVGSECFLAVWLPWHLKIDSMWAEQVARQELIDRFDLVRSRSRKAAAKLSKPAAAEAAVICRSLDRAAAYMHKYGEELTPEQCKSFMDVLVRLHSQCSALSNQHAFSQDVQLDKDKYVKNLRGVLPPAVPAR